MKLISILLSATLAFGGATSLSATNSDSDETSKSKIEEVVQMANNLTEIEDSELENILFQKSELIVSAVGNENLGETSIHQYVDDNNNSYYLLKQDIEKDELSVLSSRAILFDNEYTVLSNQETHISKSSNDTFHIEIFSNGKKIYTENTDIEYVEDQEVNQTLENWAKASMYRGLNVGCLTAIIGGGGGVAALIVKLCGAPCAFIVPVCVACLVGIVATGGGSIVAAVMNCWD